LDSREMRSKQLSLERYNTDKIANRYLEWYDPVLHHLVDQEVRLLEIGVHKGGSLLPWRDYFLKGTIIGIDLKLPGGLSDEDRIQVFRGSQNDTTFLSEVADRTAPEGFDIIIDDASHIGALTKTAFWHLFDNHLKPSVLYVIEDWGTGYWDNWPDGRTYRPERPSRSMLLLKLLQRLNLIAADMEDRPSRVISGGSSSPCGSDPAHRARSAPEGVAQRTSRAGSPWCMQCSAAPGQRSDEAASTTNHSDMRGLPREAEPHDRVPSGATSV